MATYSDLQRFTSQRYTRTSASKPWELANAADIVDTVRVETRTYPDTMYRELPADEFRNGTARIVSSSFINSSTDYERVTDSNRTWRTNMHAYTRTPAVPAKGLLPALDWGPLYNVVRKKVRNDAVNLAMALAEYRKTAEMYGALARAVASRGRTLSNALKRPAGGSKAWLAFQYGVKPHVSDILGSLDALGSRLKHPIYIRGVESRRESAIEWEQKNLVGSAIRHPAVIEHQHSRRMRCQWRAKLNNNAISNVLVRHGFANPFALAYELIPYSFVLDWWINVGDVLSSLDNLLLLDELLVINSTSTVTATYVTAGESRLNAGEWASPYTWSRISRTDNRRAPTSISSIATLRYKPSVSAQHIANGMALLHVARRRF